MTIVMTFDYCMSASLIVLSFVIVLAKHYISCEAIGSVLFDQFYPKVIEDELQ